MSTPRIPLTLWIAAGSALGASLRWGAGLAMHGQMILAGLPWGTLGVNVVGSALIGYYAAMTGIGGHWRSTPAQRAFVMAGVCGGFTTFSLFTAELLDCVQRGQWGLLALVSTTSVAAWLTGVACGHALGRWSSRGGPGDRIARDA